MQSEAVLLNGSNKKETIRRLNKKMAEKKRGLGRGLDAIFLDNTPDEKPEGASGGAVMLRLSEMEPRRDQPRKSFDTESLSSLAQSIAENGLIQPITVKPGLNGMYSIIAGERRWRACKMAGLSEVPVIIMQTDEQKTAELALVENLQREDLNVIEEAGAYKSLISDYGLTQEELSKKIGKSRPVITNALRLLELPDRVQKQLIDGGITTGHAKVLLSLTNKDDIEPLAEKIEKNGLSVRAAESAVKALNKAARSADNGEEEKEEEKVVVDYNAEIENKLTMAIGRRVRLFNKDCKKPKTISIEYTDNDDLEELIDSLMKLSENIENN